MLILLGKRSSYILAVFMIIGDITYNISITFPVEKNIPCGMFTAFSFEKGVVLRLVAF